LLTHGVGRIHGRRPRTKAARIVTAAWKDVDFGVLVWLAMTTGARRGELRGLPALVPFRPGARRQRSIAQDGSETWEKHTKTHQRRHVTLDAETVAILAEHRTRCEKRAAALGLRLAPDAYLFAASADGRTPLKPSSVTQRYDRLARRLGIDTTLHKLRHYSATELITAGVDGLRAPVPGRAPSHSAAPSAPARGRDWTSGDE
jgi:integrase